MRRVLVLVAAAAAAIAVAATSSGHPLPKAPKCPVFPADNPWNQRVDNLPVASDSASIVRSIGLDKPVHADFGSGLYQGEPIGIPYTTVSKHQRKVHVRFQYSSESDRVGYPIPRNVPVEGGQRSTGDRHVIVVDRSRCRLYELSGAYPVSG